MYTAVQLQCLELDHLALALLLSSQLEMLGSLDGALKITMYEVCCYVIGRLILKQCIQ